MKYFRHGISCRSYVVRERNKGNGIQAKHTAGITLKSPPYAGLVSYHVIRATGIGSLDT